MGLQVLAVAAPWRVELNQPHVFAPLNRLFQVRVAQVHDERRALRKRDYYEVIDDVTHPSTTAAATAAAARAAASARLAAELGVD